MSYPDEIEVNMTSALGQSMGTICLPKVMEADLIASYLRSGAVKFAYLHIDGKEITDGRNHNPHSAGFAHGGHDR